MVRLPAPLARNLLKFADSFKVLDDVAKRGKIDEIKKASNGAEIDIGGQKFKVKVEGNQRKLYDPTIDPQGANAITTADYYRNYTPNIQVVEGKVSLDFDGQKKAIQDLLEDAGIPKLEAEATAGKAIDRFKERADVKTAIRQSQAQQVIKKTPPEVPKKSQAVLEARDRMLLEKNLAESPPTPDQVKNEVADVQKDVKKVEEQLGSEASNKAVEEQVAEAGGKQTVITEPGAKEIVGKDQKGLDEKAADDINKQQQEKLKEAQNKGSVDPEVVKEGENQQKFWTTRKKVIAGLITVFGTATGTALGMYYRNKAIEEDNARLALEHQKSINGCWIRDKNTGVRTKLKLLSCGHYDFGPVMETCGTQSWSASTAAGAITECPKTTFNPCAQSSKSRSSDASFPLVPNVCDKYLYKGAKPAAITGVTTIDACTDQDGNAIPETQACSVYCQTENFNLPEYLELQCVSLTYPEAYADLMSALGYNASAIFPSADTAAADKAVSKPLLIGAGVAAGVFVLLLIIYFFKNRA